MLRRPHTLLRCPTAIRSFPLSPHRRLACPATRTATATPSPSTAGLSAFGSWSFPSKQVFFLPSHLYVAHLCSLDQYGYHTSALNQIKAVLTCERTEEHIPLDNSFFPPCIQMSNFVFSFVTAVFTVGGLLGSLVANIVMDRLGRKGASQVTALFHVVGTAIMGASGSVTSLSFGRSVVTHLWLFIVQSFPDSLLVLAQA